MINKIRVLILSIAVFLSVQLFSQENFRVGISMGTVVPIQEFASIDNSEQNAGFASGGFTLNFDGDYYLHNRLAVSGRFHFGMSGMMEKDVYNWMKGEMGDYYLEDSLSTSIDYWQWSAPLLGIKYNYPLIINKFYIEAGAFSGLNISAVPGQEMKVRDFENKRNIIAKNYGKSKTTMPFMLDGGFRLIMGENMELKLNASYYQAQSSFKRVLFIAEDGQNEVAEEIKNYDRNIPIKALSFSAGLIYSL